jgi:hypothetical protein
VIFATVGAVRAEPKVAFEVSGEGRLCALLPREEVERRQPEQVRVDRWKSRD